MKPPAAPKPASTGGVLPHGEEGRQRRDEHQQRERGLGRDQVVQPQRAEDGEVEDADARALQAQRIARASRVRSRQPSTSSTSAREPDARDAQLRRNEAVLDGVAEQEREADEEDDDADARDRVAAGEPRDDGVGFRRLARRGRRRLGRLRRRLRGGCGARGGASDAVTVSPAEAGVQGWVTASAGRRSPAAPPALRRGLPVRRCDAVRGRRARQPGQSPSGCCWPTVTMRPISQPTKPNTMPMPIATTRPSMRRPSTAPTPKPIRSPFHIFVPLRSADCEAARFDGMNEIRSFWDELLDTRRRLNLTQRQFAARFGFPVATLRHWELGNRRPNAHGAGAALRDPRQPGRRAPGGAEGPAPVPRRAATRRAAAHVSIAPRFRPAPAHPVVNTRRDSRARQRRRAGRVPSGSTGYLSDPLDPRRAPKQLARAPDDRASGIQWIRQVPSRSGDHRHAHSHRQSPRSAATSACRPSGVTACGGIGGAIASPIREKIPRRSGLVIAAPVLAAEEAAPQAAQRHRHHGHRRALEDAPDAALEADRARPCR